MRARMAAPFDPVAEANALANSFNAAASALDRFRVNADPPLPPDQYKRLKDEATALEMRAQHFTAAAVSATLDAVHHDIDAIKGATADAVEQLQHLEDVQKGIAIATSLLTLGTAIAAGNAGTIIASAQGLADALAQGG